MARETFRLNVNKWGYVEAASPSVVVDITQKGSVTLNRKTDKTITEYAYVGIQTPPANIANRRIYSASAVFHYTDGGIYYSPTAGRSYDHTGKLGIEISSKDFDPSTLTWSNRPRAGKDYWMVGSTNGSDSNDIVCSMSGDSITDAERSEMAVLLLKIKTAILFCSSYGDLTRWVNPYKKLVDGTTDPYFEFTYDDSENVISKITQNSCPISGYVNPRTETQFQWTFEKNDTYYCIGSFEQETAELHWRVSGASEWNTVAASGSTKRITIPADTFPTAQTIEWYLSGTDTVGTASQTDTYSFSTAASTVTATAISPSNTVQSNNQPITFHWSYSSTDGFPPSRYLFRWKLATDADYTTLVDSTDIVNEYTFPAYTFPAGEIRWGVVAYNIDGVSAGGYAKTFVCYGAPEAPVVYAESVPFTTVSWQASDQQSYRIKVDDTVYGPYFGMEKTFQIPDKLEDGEHTVGVSVVGTYGLWSEWGTAAINVQNVPGEEIVLGGTGGIDAFLSWATAEETSDFLIFRDNVQIGRTAEISFTDRYAVGEHTYKVINRLSDGNYSESNEVTLDTNIDGTYISLLSGGEWLKIKYKLKSASDQEYEESVETVYNHLAGDYYPSISISGYLERKLSYSAVFPFTEEEDHAVFKSFLRKTVVMKFENGNIIAGVIDSWTVLHRKHYYTAYTFSLRQIEWEDYVDDTT